MKYEWSNVDGALLKRYPTIKRTIERARKLGFEFIGHRAYFSKRGAVYQHRLYTRDTEDAGAAVEWRHEELKGWCGVLEEAQRRYDLMANIYKEQNDQANQANNA